MGNDDNIEKPSNKTLERRKKTRRLEVKRRRKIRSESEKTIRRTNQGDATSTNYPHPPLRAAQNCQRGSLDSAF